MKTKLLTWKDRLRLLFVPKQTTIDKDVFGDKCTMVFKECEGITYIYGVSYTKEKK